MRELGIVRLEGVGAYTAKVHTAHAKCHFKKSYKIKHMNIVPGFERCCD